MRVVRPVFCIAATLLALAPAAHADYAPVLPAELALRVENTTPYAQSGFVVRSGVPIARTQALTGTTGFAILDDLGAPVPATFRVLARWNAGRADAVAPLQWVLVAFPADVAPNAARTYRLVTNGSVANPAPSQSVVVSDLGGQFEIATGVATFRVGANALAPFDSVRFGASAANVTGGSAQVVVDGTTVTTTNAVRRLELVHQDALSAIVVTESELAAPIVGGGRLA